jgi:alpha,alpha-trehalase
VSPAIDPQLYDAVLFDLDGVITDTASVHAAAWAEMFDDYLRRRAELNAGGEGPGASGGAGAREPETGGSGASGEAGARDLEDLRPFTPDDYRRHVDGKLREDGVADFLASRGITLPRGDSSDAPDVETVHGLGNRKDQLFLSRVAAGGVAVFPSTVALVRTLREAGLHTGVFSGSRNCRQILESVGISDLFPVRVDGVVAEELGLPGKPDPATLLEAARRVGAEQSRAVIVEDALSGVEAGRRGGFGLVIGVDRTGRADEMRRRGADVVVPDLAEVDVAAAEPRPLSAVPHALDVLAEVLERLRDRAVGVFLDFDGALSPIVEQPDTAQPAPGAADALRRLSQACPVAIVSGRDLPDVRRRVGVEGIWYAGSHGYALAGPGGEEHEYEEAHDALPALDAAEALLRDRLAAVAGVVVERKKFSVTAHYRMTPAERVDEVTGVVEEAAAGRPGLRATRARKAAELVPDLEWNKGYAVRWLLAQVSPPEGRLTPVYAGDDLTDEDALHVVADVGLGVVVRSTEHGDRLTYAHVAVDSPDELVALLGRLADALAPAAAI